MFDLGITNAFTIEASMWGAVDASQAASAEGEDFGQAVSCFGPSKLQLMGAQLGRALVLQHSLQPMVAARLRSSPAWDSDRGGPWPTLFPEKEPRYLEPHR
ncbi:unnamed protein product [Effrenium voratum]|nr:unnamed protein product [Effrenium voratum]